MKLRTAQMTIGAMALIIVVLCWALIYYSRDELGTQAARDDEQIRAVSTATIEEGRPAVRIPAQSQAAAGIALEALKAASREDAFEVYGSVANLQPLAELRGRYLAAMAESKAARATLAAAEADFRRMETLFRDDRNVSEQALKSAEARYRTELARQAAAEQSPASLRDAMRGAWGEAVTAWAVNPDSHTMRSLLQQASFLVQLVISHEVARTGTRGRISVAPAMARENLRAARFVSASPQIDPAVPGETYFYLVDGGNLRAGMRVVGRVSRQGAAQQGVIVPAAAVVWHAGKAWAYVRDDEQTFARFEVATTHEMQGGWFSTGFAEGDQVVVSGAQLLLSEELKYQIRNENED